MDAIASEGVPVIKVDADYDGAVAVADSAAKAAGKNGILVQDMSWPGYEDPPAVSCQLSGSSHAAYHGGIHDHLGRD